MRGMRASRQKNWSKNLSKIAQEGFLTVKNAEGKTIVKPEDAKTLKFPLISYEEREKAVARGYLSGYAKWCKLPWGKDYFEPYMKALQKQHMKKWTPMNTPIPKFFMERRWARRSPRKKAKHAMQPRKNASPHWRRNRAACPKPFRQRFFNIKPLVRATALR